MKHPTADPARPRMLWHGPLLVALGMMQACASEPAVATAKPESKEPVAVLNTITVTDSVPSVIPETRLTVSLLEVKDERCPTNARCVWAGHAAVTLQVASDGAAPATIVIGTQAPADMQLPYEADYGNYRFRLIELQPARASTDSVPLSSYSATVQVSPL